MIVAVTGRKAAAPPRHSPSAAHRESTATHRSRSSPGTGGWADPAACFGAGGVEHAGAQHAKLELADAALHAEQRTNRSSPACTLSANRRALSARCDAPRR